MNAQQIIDKHDIYKLKSAYDKAVLDYDAGLISDDDRRTHFRAYMEAMNKASCDLDYAIASYYN